MVSLCIWALFCRSSPVCVCVCVCVCVRARALASFGEELGLLGAVWVGEERGAGQFPGKERTADREPGQGGGSRAKKSGGLPSRVSH